jgi:dsRNA-specific ribonuclease
MNLDNNNCLIDNQDEINSDSDSDTNTINTNSISNIQDEILVYNPYNPINIQINEENVYEILKKYNIITKPYNINLYRRAFIHRSYTKRPKLENNESNIIISDKPDDCLSLSTKSNERLEFLGDGVLECITKLYLYKRFPKADEGFMTEKKIALVKNEHIGKLAYQIGLQKYFVISKNAEEKNTRNNVKKLGCLFEAFVGALFLDYNRIQINDESNWFNSLFSCGPGFQMAQIFVENVFETHVNWIELIKNDENYKNQLQVIIQKEFKLTPDYIEIEKNKDYELSDKIYTMGVFICFGQNIHNANINECISFDTLNSFQKIHNLLLTNDKLLIFLSKASNKIKKKAEQLACEKAIENIKQIK